MPAAASAADRSGNGGHGAILCRAAAMNESPGREPGLAGPGQSTRDYSR